ncbi:MAG: DEAD/DEAH box helicase [Planctomycetota bacterium]
MRFDAFELHPTVLNNLAAKGYEEATPIQSGAIPVALEGRDVLGSAQTGTGKTAAFALPIVHRLLTTNQQPKKSDKRPRALILSPTRELTQQIADGFAAYAKGTGLRGVTIYGGTGQRPQTNALQRGVDVVIATPGRLMDLMEQGFVDLSAIQTFVLDEADRMLDMGFIHDITKISNELPKQRQTLFFSATLPKAIQQLVAKLLKDPQVVSIAPEKPTVDRVKQSVKFVAPGNKVAILANLIEDHGMFRTVVFTRTKHGADKVVKQLRAHDVKSEAIHGNKSQAARQRALNNFKNDKVAVLVATDVAARGIDVPHVSHVVNYDLTHEPETYVHRIGRTARAGQEGDAISLCTPDEIGWLRAIERLIGMDLDILGDKPDWAIRTTAGTGMGGMGGGKRKRGPRSSGGGGGRSPRGGSAGKRNGQGGGSESGKSYGHMGGGSGGGTKSSRKPRTGKPNKGAKAAAGKAGKPGGGVKKTHRKGGKPAA